MNYSESDIREAVSQSAFSAGVGLKKQRQVLSTVWQTDDHLTAQVQGSQRRPYTQQITFESEEEGTLIEGLCTCPVGYNCKHVAAALLQALASPKPAPVSPETVMAQRMARLLEARGPSSGPATRPDGLRVDIASWLEALERAEDTADDTYPPNVAQRLVYVLVPTAREGRFPALGVQPISVRLLKSGQFSDAGRPFPIERATSGQEAKFLRPADVRILGDLTRLRREFYGRELSLRHDDGRILEAVLATGRARWLKVNGPVLEAGAPMAGRIAWNPGDGVEMRPTIEIEGDRVVLAGMPPVYVDATAGTVGTVDTGLAPKLAGALLDAPPIAADQVARVSQAMARRGPGLSRVRPPEPRPPRVVEEPPVPGLHLLKERLPSAAAAAQGYYGYGLLPPEEEAAVARLSFRYGDVSVDLREPRTSLTRLHGGELVEIRRDGEAERRHIATLLSIGFIPIGETRPAAAHRDIAKDFEIKGSAVAWFELLYHDVPALTAQGWTVEIAPDFPHQVLRAEGDVSAEVHEGSGIDWFELDLGVVVDGERIDLVGPLVAIISADGFDPALLRPRAGGDGPDPEETLYVPLGDGRVLAISAARLAPMVAAIYELFTGGNVRDGRVRLTTVDAASLAAFEDATREAGIAWRGGQKLREMGRKLSDSGGIPRIAPPPGFQASLRPYQADGVSWLSFLRDVGFGGVLADDMGLGKTVQTLAFIAIEKFEGRLDRPALVIAPTSLMSNWRREAERFAPDLRVLTLQGLDRKERFAEIAGSDLVLTTYPLISRDHEVLMAQPWHLLILDEAQTIKNPDATTTKLVLGLEARHRFCLSGTPLENHLGELWSLFRFAVPGLLGDRTDFTRLWRTPIEKLGNASRASALARRVRPFMLRRTKEQVAPDLPPKTEIVERIEFQPPQRDIYESIRLTMHKRVRDAIAEKGFNRSRIVILDALLKLRQVCCDPRLLKLTTKTAGRAGSAKLERLDEMLAELVAEKRRIIVFSQFTSMLDLIRPRLSEVGIPYSLLTGDTRDRETEIRSFQDGKTPIFLVSLKAGGTGLNLTAADTVILYDPWWNPAVEEQAIDRAHRIGQDKPVFVHKLVAVGTIEEKMETLKQKKRALAESLFDQDGSPTLDMTESDLDMLFAAE